MDWVTTSTILGRLRKLDDRTMWAKFDGRFRRPLVALGMKLGLSPTDAEESAQEAMVAFMQEYQSGKYDRERGRLSSWLFGIAHTTALNRRRKLAREAARQGPIDDTRAPVEDLADPDLARPFWEAQWEASVLATCLEQLRAEITDKTYEAFRMVVREGIEPEKAAAALGMSRDAVYVAKHRVLKRMAELMKDVEESAPGE